MAFAAPAHRLPLRRGVIAPRASPRVPLRSSVRVSRRPLRAALDDGLIALRDLQKPDAPLPGTVYLVGAGPGDVGLLTIRARDILANADVVLYDRLAAEGALAYANPAATTLYVGKTAGFHTRTQTEIHALLAAFASTHKTVVRLKGGDPCVFGRGGEEAAYLRSLGVNVQIVPGVTAASGIAASLGFPLTHRGLSNCVRIVTGHLQNGRNPDVGQVSHLTTLVLYMGLAQLPQILDELHQSGLSPRTPAVAVERGTTDREIVVWGTIAELAAKVATRGLRSPTLVVVGEVVALAQGWVDEMEMGNAAKSQRRVDELMLKLRPEDQALLLQSMHRSC